MIIPTGRVKKSDLYTGTHHLAVEAILHVDKASNYSTDKQMQQT